jgi:hypothetical protein
MATWAEAKAAVLEISTFNGKEVNDKLIAGVVNLENGRTQQVFVGGVADKLVLMSIVCKLEQVNLNGLFTAEAFQQLPYGLSAVSDNLVFKHSTLLETLDMKEIVAPLVEMAFAADALELGVTGSDTY